MGEAACLVILPKELVSRIVDITGGMGTVRNTQNVAVVVIGVGIGYIISCSLQTVGGNLPACPLFGLPFGDGRTVPFDCQLVRIALWLRDNRTAP